MHWGFQPPVNSSELEFRRGWGQSNIIAWFSSVLKREESVSREQTQRQGGNGREWIKDTKSDFMFVELQQDFEKNRCFPGIGF